MALKLQYFFETNSHFGKRLKTEIWRETYEGEPKRINFGSGNPIKISYPSNNNDDIFYPIWGGGLTIDFYEQQDLALENIITDYERQVRIDQYVNGELYYRGWVVPDLCHDSAYRTNYLLSLTATDAIGDLSNFPFLVASDELALINDTSDFGYYGVDFNAKQLDQALYDNPRVSIISIIKDCLNKADLDFGYKLISDIYETSLRTQDERVFEKVFTNYLCYVQDNESKTCEDVLISIFRTFGLIVVQKGGIWNIIRVPYLISDTAVCEYYDKDVKFISSKKENIRRILRPEDTETKKHWHFILDDFTREPRRPYQYQNIEYNYGETLVISDYGLNNWTAKNLTVTNGTSANGSNYFEFFDDKFWYLQNIISVINNSPLSESEKRKRKNNEYYEYIKTGVFSEIIEVPNKTNLTIEFSSSAKKGVFIIYAEGDKGNGVIERYYYFPAFKFWYSQTYINYSSTKIDLLATQIIFETKDDFNDQRERNYSIPIKTDISYLFDSDNVKLTIIVRGGTLDDGDTPEMVFYRNLVVKTTQAKEAHAFTNLNKVSNKPEPIEVLNGDGFGTGQTISSYLIQKETTTFPYISKPYATKLWKDSGHQEPNNLLSFTAQNIVSQYASHRNIVKGNMRTARNIKLGDVLSFSNYSKFAYKRFVVMPPFSYDLKEDIYSLTLFEISCDVAKGRLKEYYIDNDDTPLYKRVIDFEGSVCEPNLFEWEVECQEEVFTIETVC